MVVFDIIIQWFLVSWISYFIVGYLVNFDKVDKRVANAFAISVFPTIAILYLIVKLQEFSKEESISLLCSGWRKEYRPYSYIGNGFTVVGIREFIIEK